MSDNTKDTPLDYKHFEGHTPAPWKHSVLKGRVLFFSIPEDGFVFMTIEDRHFIASQRHQEWIANARLINAAPDLLKENKKLKLELQKLQNDLDDALDVKNGKGPTALSRLSNELQKQKELNAELVKFVQELLDDHRNLCFMMDFENRAESLIKKSSEI